MRFHKIQQKWPSEQRKWSLSEGFGQIERISEPPAYVRRSNQVSERIEWSILKVPSMSSDEFRIEQQTMSCKVKTTRVASNEALFESVRPAFCRREGW